MEQFITEEEIKQITLEIVDLFLKPEFTRRGHNASGNWMNSLDVRVQMTDTGFSSFIMAPDYTYYLIFGRGPNKDQSPEGIKHFVGWAGQYLFGPWARQKGINANPYAIAYTIAKEGTREYRMGDHTFLNVLENSEVRAYLNNRVTGFISARIAGTLRTEMQKTAAV